MKVCVSSARSSLACSASGNSPISSRKSVPPVASSNFPGLRICAPVKAPRSWPNSSDSRISAGIAAQSTGRNVWRARGEWRWIARATSSLPAPDSPRISTDDRAAATCWILRNSSSIAGVWPTIPSNAPCSTRIRSTSRNSFTSRPRRTFSTSVVTRPRRTSRLTGFSR